MAYSGYGGLPELVGLHTMEEALEKGLSVSESVDRLKRYHWTMKRLSLILNSRITATPIYEIKMALGLHTFYLAEHVEPIFNRVREMRQPPYGMDAAPHPALDLLLDEIQGVPELEPFLLGVYGKLIPALIRGLTRHIEDSNKLFDHPTFRVCRFALLEMREVAAYGVQALDALVDEAAAAAHSRWLSLLDDCLAAMGDLDGTQPRHEHVPQRIYSSTPFVYNPIPARDERFRDGYNMGVNAEVFLLDPQREALPKTIMLYFKRMREIDVPEMMSSIIEETQGKPWGYYRDMIRQLWDESRHAMMGEVGFTSLDIDWRTIPFNHTWSYLLNTRMTPIERHAILYYIEQGLMPASTGKQYEWEVAVATADKLTALIQDYDWADEVLHARIGRDWLVPELGGQKAAIDFGNAAWTKSLTNSYDDFLERGLTRHDNWWPRVYTEACAHWRIQPDPTVLAYSDSYRDSRPDRAHLANA